MMLMCTLFYTPIRHLRVLPVEGSVLFAVIAVFYCIRLFIFYPAMGRLNVMSHTFVESWKEGECPRIPTPEHTGWNDHALSNHKLPSTLKRGF